MVNDDDPDIFDIDNPDCLALPPSPLCEVCFHNLCPCCPLPWCDIVLEDEDMTSCCDGDCKCDLPDFKLWQKHVTAVRNEYPDMFITSSQLGPPKPYSRLVSNTKSPVDDIAF